MNASNGNGTTSSFSTLMDEMIQNRLQLFVDRKVDRQTMMEIYATIFNTVSDVFASSNVNLSNEAVNLAAQVYYDDLDINGRNEVDSEIFTRRAKPENVPNHELVVLTMLWKDHPNGQVFLRELKRR